MTIHQVLWITKKNANLRNAFESSNIPRKWRDKIASAVIYVRNLCSHFQMIKVRVPRHDALGHCRGFFLKIFAYHKMQRDRCYLAKIYMKQLNVRQQVKGANG